MTLTKKKIKKKPRVRILKEGKYYSARGVELTRASGTKTEAEMAAFILSILRRGTKFWKPKMDKKLEGRRPSESSNKKLKWEYHCEQCNEWFPESNIEIDHIVNCGGISGLDWLDKIKPWIIKAYIEIDGYQRLCKQCHAIKTAGENK